MHGCICESCPHTSTPTHRCRSAKLRAHCVAQEVTVDRHVGHLRRCHTCFYKDQESKTQYALSIFPSLKREFARCPEVSIHRNMPTRPNRIISAVAQSILLAGGGECRRGKRNLWSIWKRAAQKAKFKQAAYITKWDICISGRDCTRCV